MRNKHIFLIQYIIHIYYKDVYIYIYIYISIKIINYENWWILCLASYFRLCMVTYVQEIEKESAIKVRWEAKQLKKKLYLCICQNEWIFLSRNIEDDDEKDYLF